MQLDLPWPPSVNTYWRNPPGGRPLISKKGREYRKRVFDEVLINRRRLGPLPMAGRLSLCLQAYPPDHRKRDLDNLLKAICDSLAHAGVYEDDSQIDWIVIGRGEVVPGGLVTAVINEINIDS